MSEEEYDFRKLRYGIYVLLLVAILLYGVHFYLSYQERIGYREECQQNPQLLYAQRCSNKEDCIAQCVAAREADGQ